MASSRPNFIRMKPMDPTWTSHATVKATDISAYRPFGLDQDRTEVMLSNGETFVSNETVADFEVRLGYALHPYYIE